jgi:hypothetical protein
MNKKTLLLAASLVLLATPALAQQQAAELEACRASSVIALRETLPDLKQVHFDEETLSAAKANTRIEDTAVTGVIMGDAYLEEGRKGKARRFVCILGEKGKVLLTFFTRN